MSILAVVIVLAVIGFVLYLINTRIPMDSTIKLIINIIVIVAVVIWLLRATGLWAEVAGAKL